LISQTATHSQQHNQAATRRIPGDKKFFGSFFQKRTLSTAPHHSLASKFMSP
jgi:hypothetical protein